MVGGFLAGLKDLITHEAGESETVMASVGLMTVTEARGRKDLRTGTAAITHD